MSDDKNTNEDDFHYKCRKCGKRIHRDEARRLGLAHGGDMICCGESMAHPMTASTFLVVALMIVILGGPFLLYFVLEWNIWVDIFLPLVVSTLFFERFATDNS